MKGRASLPGQCALELREAIHLTVINHDNPTTTTQIDPVFLVEFSPHGR